MNYSLPFLKNQKILEIGGGTSPFFRPNFDMLSGENIDRVINPEEKLPINDESFDGIYISSFVQHLSWKRLPDFFQECFRILKSGGKAVFIAPNTEEKIKFILENSNQLQASELSEMLFGSQTNQKNSYRNFMNPEHASKLCADAGFSNVSIIPANNDNSESIIIVEATKPEREIMNSEKRQSLFDKHYFNGGSKVGGYAHEGYWDYPVHWLTFEKLMELKPESVLEIGAARGYLVKRFESVGIPAKGLEISKHCHLTRVTDSVLEFDICQTPWPFKDKEFDLCYSVAVMEHIPEEYLPEIVKEMERVSKRGLHGIDYGHEDDGFDKTHCTLKPQEWWDKTLPVSQKAVNKEDLEKGSLSLSIPSGDGKLKLNIGSFTVMFHHGWINMDIVPLDQFASAYQYKFVQYDARGRMPFENDSVDYIVCSHLLEHLNQVDGYKFLVECKRVLKSDGVARFIVPDASKLIAMYQNKELAKFDEINEGCERSAFESAKLWSLLFEGHAIAYDYEGLKTIGEDAGFSVKFCQFNQGTEQIIKETMDFLPDLSLYVELTKP